MVINSLDNKKIKKYASLRYTKNRDEYGLFIVEGEHLVLEALKNNVLVDVLLLENENISFNVPFPITYVTDLVLKKVSTLTNPSNIIGICKIKSDNSLKGDRLLLLDDIQDPGNLGTIIRSACAFNIDTIVLSPNTVSLYNDKVIRATQGMLFKVNIITSSLEELIPYLKLNGYLILGTNVNNGEDISNVVSYKYALVMGNEGNGVKREIQQMCDKNIYIPMSSDCESLNVGVATSILIYELNKRGL